MSKRLISRSYVDKAPEVQQYTQYDNVPTPTEYPIFGKGLVPRKNEQDMQAQKAKQRYQPFGIKDIYLKKKFVLEKHVPYYYRKQKPPKPITKLPPIGRRIAHQLEDSKGHRKNSAVGTNPPLILPLYHPSLSNGVSTLSIVYSRTI